jgi:hypothetical protein
MPQLRHQIHLAKKSLLEVFTILCANLQLACKALIKKKIGSLFGGHFISMNIPPKKTYS